MRFTTIWTMPACTLREKLARTCDELWRRAAHRLPKKLKYFVLIDSGVHHMETNEIVPDVTFLTVLQRAGEGVKVS